MNEQKDDNTKKVNAYIKKAKTATFFQRLSAFFGYSRKNDKIQVTDTEKYSTSQPLNKIPFKPMSATVEKMLDKYISETMTNYASSSDRLDRVNELTWLVCNSSKVSMAVDTIVDEVVYTHAKSCVYGKSPDQKEQKYIDNLIDSLKIDTALCKDIVRDLAAYGECYLGLEVDQRGIQSVTKLPETAVKAKLEFSYIRAKAYFNSAEAANSIPQAMVSPFFATMTGADSCGAGDGSTATSFIKDYLDNMEEHGAVEFKQAFKQFNFGYIGDDGTYYFPWDIIHIRLSGDTSINEFWPYDRPPLIACVDSWKQMKNSLARASLIEDLSVPYTLYEVKAPGTSPEADFDFVQEVRSEFESNGVDPDSGDQELPAINTSIWTAQGLVTVTTQQRTKDDASKGSQDLAKMFDAELTNGTGIPKAWLQLDSDSYNKELSGVALQELCAPFSRKCQNYRNALLDGLAQIVSLDAVIKQKELKPFALKMTIIPRTSDLNSGFKEYINSLFEIIGQALGVAPEELPLFIKRDIIYKYSPISKADIVRYTNEMSPKDLQDPFGKVKDADEMSDDVSGGGGGDMGGGDMGGGAEAPEPEPSSDEGSDNIFGENTIKGEKLRHLYEDYKKLNIERLTEMAIFTAKSDTFDTPDGAVIGRFSMKQINNDSYSILEHILPRKLHEKNK